MDLKPNPKGRILKLPLFLIILIFSQLSFVNAQTYPGKVGVGISHLELVDLAKYLRAFTAPDGTEVQVDANGWPMADAQTVLFDFRPVPEWEAGASLDDPEEYRVDRSGTYKASFEGQADVGHVEGPFTIENKVYDPNTNTTKFDIVIGAPGPHHGLVILNFVNTKRTASSALNSGITNLKVIRPGYAENTTQVFTDDFLNGIANGNFSTLRFMGATHTNGSNPFYPEVTEWSQRARLENATFNSDDTGREPGIPWELAVDLGNATNTDIWVNVPVAATDDYITQLANFIKNRLNPGLKVYVEYSNEVWNWGFSQSVWNNQNAEAQGLNYIKGYAKRTAEIAMIFKNVYGASAMNNDVRVISAWQIGWNPPDPMYEEQMQYMNDNFGPPKDYIYGLGVAPYFNCGDVCETGTVQEILAAMRQSSDESRLDREKIVAVASNWQIPGGMISYEAGSDTGGGSATNIANKIRAERSAEMKEIYLYDARENWFAIGGGLQMYLELVGSYSRYGSWGLTDDMSNVDRNYKFAAVRELAGSDATTAPPTPDGLTATPGNATVSLSWSPASTSDHYNVKRSTSSGGPYTVIGSPSTTSYTDNTVSNETTYYYVVSAVNSVGESGNSSQVSATPTSTSTTTVVREYWTGITGTSVADIPVSTTPTGTDNLSSLEGPTNWGDDYGSRIRAFITPATSGDYTFYIAGDDNTELWLSTDNSPANAGLIASVTGWTSSKEWNKYPSQQSTAISLIAGTKYYVEVLHKEGGGGDNVAVGWTGPGIADISVIGSPYLDPYEAQVPSAPTNLSASAGDATVNLSWDAVSGATSYNVKRHTGGNFNTVATGITADSYQDNNLVNGTTYYYVVTAVNENGESNISNTAEATPSASSASIVREYWTGITGTTVADIPVSTTPTGTDNLSSLEGPTNWGDDYGSRIRAFITPATSGDYTFYIAGDDNTELWLSTDNSPANAGLIASVTGWTSSREWNKYTSQQSTAISLTAGTKYYVEVLHKEGTGGDNVAVGWTGPDITDITVISGSVLSPYSESTSGFSGTYKITARHSNKALDLTNSSMADGANIQQWTDNGTAAQQWIITATTDGYYKIVSKESDKALEVSNNSMDDGGNVQQWSYVEANSQQWKIEATSDGYHRLINRHSGKVLDVAGVSLDDGANIHQWTYGGGNNQQWKLEQLSKATSSGNTRLGSTATSDLSLANSRELTVYPNPVTDGRLTIQLTAKEKGKASLTLTSVLGQNAAQREISVEEGQNTFGISSSGLASGLYLLTVKQGNSQLVRKVYIK